MGKLFAAARAMYSRYVPAPVRESGWIARVKEKIPHDLMYDDAYYADQVDPAALKAAAVMGPAIASAFQPKSVIDVGCGTGALLSALRDCKCDTYGLEYAEAGLTICRSRGLDVRKFDIEHDTLDDSRKFDVAISMEVAEHLPERCANRFIDLLTSLAPVTVFTAAYPGQGGADHVNEQPAAYWIEKFTARGFSVDSALSARWKEQWKAADIAPWYWHNVLVFRRS